MFFKIFQFALVGILFSMVFNTYRLERQLENAMLSRGELKAKIEQITADNQSNIASIQRLKDSIKHNNQTLTKLNQQLNEKIQYHHTTMQELSKNITNEKTTDCINMPMPSYVTRLFKQTRT